MTTTTALMALLMMGSWILLMAPTEAAALPDSNAGSGKILDEARSILSKSVDNILASLNGPGRFKFSYS